MLKSLHVENFVLIDSLDIDFPEGLVIITGQTGAGKSILLGALSLLTGAKADASVISEGADSCVVEAEFVVDKDNENLKTLLEEADAEWDGGHLLIRRVVHASGRSRSFLNDSPVSVQLLSDIAGYIIDIHSQHQSLMLTSRSFQLSLLDNYCGASALKADLALAWQNLRSLASDLSKLRDELGKLSAERDYNQAQYDQLEKARLRSGEVEELEEEQKCLANAEEIRSGLAQALSSLNVCQGLKDARRSIEKTGVFIPALSELGDRLESSRIEIEDIISELESRADSVDVSPERLEAVEDRLSTLYQLMRKHGVNSVEELISIRDMYSGKLFDSSSLELKEQELERSLGEAREKYDSLAAGLSSLRASRAGALAGEIQNSIRALELDRAVFEIRLSAGKPGPGGIDDIDCLFSSNGTAPVELSKCASGGEISRIMLCLKDMMARYVGMPTLIFDEIDTGVSGSVAHKMGRMICSMGDNMQVFAITHLPQVAAKGCAHYVVSKSLSPDGRTLSSIRLLDRDSRVREIARLLSGETITPEALANAESLLSQ